MSDDSDPWGFLAPKTPKTPQTPKTPKEPKAETETGAEVAPKAGPDGSGDSGGVGGVGKKSGSGRAAGEFRAQMSSQSVRTRAWPLAVALALIFLAGFSTEVAAASQMIALAGTGSLLIIYPLGGLILLLVAVLQYRYVDHQSRLRVARIASFGYAIVLGAAWLGLTLDFIPIVSAGVIWLLADQINFLLPLLIWSIAADEFNVAEGRKVFGWLVAWTYVGQVGGLALAFVVPFIFEPLGLPLTTLLILAPLIMVVVGIWLPRAMKSSSASKGSDKDDTYSDSFKGAIEFVQGVPIWRSLIAASTLTFIAGSVVIMGFSIGVGDIVGSDAKNLQLIFSGTWLAAIAVCWLLQTFVAEKIENKLGVPGTLLILPIATAIAAIALAFGIVTESIVILVIAITIWRIPRWSLDENARRGALSLVPDEKRTRVSFLMDLAPVAIGLVLASPIVLFADVVGLPWLAGAIALVFAALAIPIAKRVLDGWEDSLSNWRLRRRKRNRAISLDVLDALEESE